MVLNWNLHTHVFSKWLTYFQGHQWGERDGSLWEFTTSSFFPSLVLNFKCKTFRYLLTCLFIVRFCLSVFSCIFSQPQIMHLLNVPTLVFTYSNFLSLTFLNSFFFFLTVCVGICDRQTDRWTETQMETDDLLTTA